MEVKSVMLEGKFEILEWFLTVNILNMRSLSIEVILREITLVSVLNDPIIVKILISDCFDLKTFANFHVIIKVSNVFDSSSTSDILVEFIILRGVFVSIAMF